MAAECLERFADAGPDAADRHREKSPGGGPCRPLDGTYISQSGAAPDGRGSCASAALLPGSTPTPPCEPCGLATPMHGVGVSRPPRTERTRWVRCHGEGARDQGLTPVRAVRDVASSSRVRHVPPARCDLPVAPTPVQILGQPFAIDQRNAVGPCRHLRAEPARRNIRKPVGRERLETSRPDSSPLPDALPSTGRGLAPDTCSGGGAAAGHGALIYAGGFRGQPDAEDAGDAGKQQWTRHAIDPLRHGAWSEQGNLLTSAICIRGRNAMPDCRAFLVATDIDRDQRAGHIEQDRLTFLP